MHIVNVAGVAVGGAVAIYGSCIVFFYHGSCRFFSKVGTHTSDYERCKKEKKLWFKTAIAGLVIGILSITLLKF